MHRHSFLIESISQCTPVVFRFQSRIQELVLFKNFVRSVVLSSVCFAVFREGGGAAAEGVPRRRAQQGGERRAHRRGHESPQPGDAPVSAGSAQPEVLQPDMPLSEVLLPDVLQREGIQLEVLRRKYFPVVTIHCSQELKGKPLLASLLACGQLGLFIASISDVSS